MSKTIQSSDAVIWHLSCGRYVTSSRVSYEKSVVFHEIQWFPEKYYLPLLMNLLSEKLLNNKKGLTTFQDIFGFNKTLLKLGGSLIQRETLV